MTLYSRLYKIITDEITQYKILKQAKFGVAHYFGFEPKGWIQNFFYQRKLKKAIAELDPEDRLAQLKADRSAAGTKLIEELDQRPETVKKEDRFPPAEIQNVERTA